MRGFSPELRRELVCSSSITFFVFVFPSFSFFLFECCFIAIVEINSGHLLFCSQFLNVDSEASYLSFFLLSNAPDLPNCTHHLIFNGKPHHALILPHSLLGFLDAFSHLYKRVCPSVRRSVRHTRVEFLRNGPNSNKGSIRNSKVCH